MRIDNTDAGVIGLLELNSRPGFDLEDPGTIEPVDLCQDCAHELFEPPLLGELEIDHPPYTDDGYTCFQCNQRLDDADRE